MLVVIFIANKWYSIYSFLSLVLVLQGIQLLDTFPFFLFLYHISCSVKRNRRWRRVSFFCWLAGAVLYMQHQQNRTFIYPFCIRARAEQVRKLQIGIILTLLFTFSLLWYDMERHKQKHIVVSLFLGIIFVTATMSLIHSFIHICGTEGNYWCLFFYYILDFKGFLIRRDNTFLCSWQDRQNNVHICMTPCFWNWE